MTDTPAPDVDALRVPCPACTADPGEACVKPNGDRATKTHKRRIKAAQDAARDSLRAEVPTRLEGDRWRRLYRACRLELEQRGDWTLLAAEQLEGMVLNMREAADARVGVRAFTDRGVTERLERLVGALDGDKHGAIIEGLRELLHTLAEATGPLTKGSTGQLTANPLYLVAKRCDDSALAYAKALKLTPDTRGTNAPFGAQNVPGEAAGADDDDDELAPLFNLAERAKRKRAG